MTIDFKNYISFVYLFIYSLTHTVGCDPLAKCAAACQCQVFHLDAELKLVDVQIDGSSITDVSDFSKYRTRFTVFNGQSYSRLVYGDSCTSHPECSGLCYCPNEFYIFADDPNE